MDSRVVYVVQDLVSGGFLRPDSGDVGRTDRLRDAGGFEDIGEAYEAGIDHCDGSFDVVPLIFVREGV
ncbi:hypothetical protein WJ63_33305 [Burkholderia pyrrocinia]|uniref:hypothetical protein n=1 Tax=Burkholderia stagnalis TaxID=1503054 RepID=UPI0007567718|nr:hypothetical protein [Burkholderia stagnalis]KVN37560.1 hypothetical protein WJ63_33305 [Burkholderia pyrrocinia]KVM97244.1 hypothetical protein WT07_01940 [Burkholderia stagnalis]KVW94501.1 hypothetical protein WT30_16920 [Burkholderia stagnalis]KWH49141.1 hypothetical protein WT61_20395 [Burkholderia stagnalis]KWH57222.1 hypothetical protein WT62_30840 [Burkholderia stagnalis]